MVLSPDDLLLCEAETNLGVKKVREMLAEEGGGGVEGVLRRYVQGEV